LFFGATASAAVDRALSFAPENADSTGKGSSPARRVVFPGSLPMSVRATGRLFRYHNRAFVYPPDAFWRTFVDGEWKWRVRGRFAGVNINTAHYFGVTAQSALLEISHYASVDAIASDYELLCVEGELDNILDFTSISHLEYACKAMNISVRRADLVSAVVNPASRGSDLTDRLGYFAERRGYSGVVFFSARAIDEADRGDIDNDRYYDEVMELFVKSEVAAAMRQKVWRLCVAVFAGTTLTRSVRRYKLADGQWQENPFFGKSAEELDGLLGNHGTAYQNAMREAFERSSARKVWLRGAS